MHTYKTIDQARAAATSDIVNIIEIDHTTEGRCYINCKSNLTVLKAALYRKPMAEIRALVQEHTVHVVADHPAYCDRCHTQVNRQTAYHQTEWDNVNGHSVKVTAYYCPNCAQLLNAVGAGEHTEMDDRQAV